MNRIDRRGFIKGAALAAGAVAAGDCHALSAKAPFYGPTIRDRLWMWGHHPDMAQRSYRAKTKPWPFGNGGKIDQADACIAMGIPNDCFIRWGNKPSHPWGNYAEQFRRVKRFSFGITDGGNGTVRDKMKWAFEELKPNFPNLTGCFFDDFFAVKSLTQTEDETKKIADEVHAHGLRLSVVLYSDQDGLKPEFKSRIGMCDETSYWFWNSKNIPSMGDSVKRCREFIGPDKDLLLGLYMWDFTLGEPVRGDRMEQQLEFARKFLADRTITGLIFHPTFIADCDFDSVKLSKQWIKSYGDTRWGA